MSSKNTICFVSEDADLRKLLTHSFKSSGINVIPLATSGEYLAQLTELKAHGCLLVDSKTEDGPVLLRELSRRRRAIPVVVLVSHGAVAAAVEAVKAGACEVAERSGDSAVEVVKKAMAGFVKMQKLLEEKQTASERIATLTRREGEVLHLMVKGKVNRKIADELGISPKTLDIHRANLMAKLSARTVAELCRAHLLDRLDAGFLPQVLGSH